jgi:hypothetical protein
MLLRGSQRWLLREHRRVALPWRGRSSSKQQAMSDCGLTRSALFYLTRASAFLLSAQYRVIRSDRAFRAVADMREV